MRLKPALILIASFFLGSSASAQSSVQWGSSDKPATREAAESMNAFFEPAKVEVNGNVRSFALYRSASPTPSDELGRYMINCETREFVSTIKGQTTAPSRVIAGEALYPLGRRLCEWDPQGGFFKKLFD